MTDDEKIVISALDRVTYLPGSWNKKFAGAMVSLMRTSPEKELSEKQGQWIYRLLYRYRRQVPEVYERYRDCEFCNNIKYKKEYGNHKES
jgi:hypothetical protein